MLLAALLGFGLLFVLPVVMLGWSLHDPDYEAQQAHLARGRELGEQGRWQEAIKEYRAALGYGDEVYAMLGVARCKDHLGDYPAALEMFGNAIDRNPGWYQPYMERAHCIERNEGAAAVAAWYAELERREGDVVKYRYLLGSHHMECGRPAEALPHLLHVVDLILERQRVTFTEDDQLAPAARIAEMEQNDLADLWPDVTEVAQCYLRTGQPDLAWRWAARGVSLHQHLCRSKGYCSPEQIEAGDTSCRLLRARIHMDRREWDAAERELRHAQAFDDLWSKNRCAEFAEELASRRGQ